MYSLKNTLFLFLYGFTIFSCSKSTNVELNKKLTSDYQDMVHEIEILEKEQTGFLEDFMKWEKEFKGIKASKELLYENYIELAKEHHLFLEKYKEEIKIQKKLLEDHFDLIKKHAAGNLSDIRLEKAQAALTGTQQKILKNHEDLKMQQEAFKEQHELIIKKTREERQK